MKTEPTRRDFLRAPWPAPSASPSSAGGRLAAVPDLETRLAVCSWSLEPASADDLLKKLAATGLRRVQIALDSVRVNAAGAWTDLAARSAAQGVTFVSGMMGTIGEDYTTLDSIRRTGGVVPDATWPENWKNIQADADLAGRLGLKLVTFHAGFLPHEESRPVVREAAGPPPPHRRPLPGPRASPSAWRPARRRRTRWRASCASSTTRAWA